MLYICTDRYTKVKEKTYVFKSRIFITAFTRWRYCPYSESNDVSSHAKLIRSLLILSSYLELYFKFSLPFTVVKSDYRYGVEVENHHFFILN